MDLINYGYSSDEAEIADEPQQENGSVHSSNGYKYSEEMENDSIGYDLEETPNESIKTPSSQRLQEDSPQIHQISEQKSTGTMDYEGLPPSPSEPCSAELKEKFIKLFGYKSGGLNINAQILDRKEFKNPAIYDKLKEDYGVNEYGTNYICSGKDNIELDPSDFYDKLAEEQSKLLDQEEKAKKPASQPTTNSSSNSHSRFEKK